MLTMNRLGHGRQYTHRYIDGCDGDPIARVVCRHQPMVLSRIAPITWN